ncbi:hypothetical protein D9757_000151 [Collybiopsis confluens]|uniref:Cyclic nucleotide-binding domain-containing protein n=1 Tax=Collybiopsis confluens TaxID=2823264 RepID=A0A8H5I2B5_9AGAR|nr:hypothetical protein D9757_000151 [Collybiopsis confluens]
MTSSSAPASSFGTLMRDLTRDFDRAQPKDALQFCSNWFQSRLEEQRARARDVLGDRHPSHSIGGRASFPNHTLSRRTSMYALGSVGDVDEAIDPLEMKRGSTSSTFSGGGRSSRGSAVLLEANQNSAAGPSPFANPFAGPSTSTRNLGSAAGGPTTFTNPFSSSSAPLPPAAPGDYLHPPTSAIFARRTSVSAESIPIEDLEGPYNSTGQMGGPAHPYYSKTPAQLSRIKTSIQNNFIFRDLDEEQETGVLNAMQEVSVREGEEVIRQGDVGEYFYVVESGILDCYILGGSGSGPETSTPAASFPTPSSPTSPVDASIASAPPPAQTHSIYGRLVASCPPGTSFGELALMYGHPRAATVLSRTPSTLWALDRITFRTIVLKAAHRRRTMYEGFLSSVTLLAGLSQAERSKIADALVSRTYEDGDVVVRQGEVGDTFFFVEEGEAIVTKRVPRPERRLVGAAVTASVLSADDDDTEEIQVGRLVKGEYFGELSLLRLAPRAATVSAIMRAAASSSPSTSMYSSTTPIFNITPSSPAVDSPRAIFPPPSVSPRSHSPHSASGGPAIVGGRLGPKLKVAALDAPAFTRLLGPLREIMERRAGESYIM